MSPWPFIAFPQPARPSTTGWHQITPKLRVYLRDERPAAVGVEAENPPADYAAIHAALHWMRFACTFGPWERVDSEWRADVRTCLRARR